MFAKAKVGLLVLGAAVSSVMSGPVFSGDGGCGVPKTPCIVEGGEYFIERPAVAQTPPAVIWLHGYARSGKSMIQKPDYVDPFIRRGYAVIMPSGQPFGDKGNLDWGVDDGYDHQRDDAAFVQAVRDSAVERFDLDPQRILIAGFSRGGSMVWDLACQAPDLGAGFAAAAGAFWEPMGNTCTAPVHLFHTHGFGDRLVPFEGREVHFQGVDFAQGNVMKGLDIWRRTNGCMKSAENSFGEDGMMQKDWPDCAAGSIRLQLTKGGHAVPKGWRDAVLDWFEALP